MNFPMGMRQFLMRQKEGRRVPFPPQRNPVIQGIINKVTQSRLWVFLPIFVTVIPLEVLEGYDITVTRLEPTIKACAVSNSTQTDDWDQLDFSLENCYKSGFIECNGWSMQVNIDRPGGTITTLLILLGTILIFFVTIYQMLLRRRSFVLRLLPYKIYVGIQKYQYYSKLAILAILVITYSYLKYKVFGDLSDHVTRQCKNQQILLLFEENYKGTIVSLIERLFIFGWAFQGVLTMYWEKFNDFYSDLTFKLIARFEHPEPFAEFTQMKKLEKKDLEMLYKTYIHEIYTEQEIKRRRLNDWSKSSDAELDKFVQWLYQNGYSLKPLYQL